MSEINVTLTTGRVVLHPRYKGGLDSPPKTDEVGHSIPLSLKKANTERESYVPKTTGTTPLVHLSTVSRSLSARSSGLTE